MTAAAEEDVLLPTTAETREWLQALTAKWPPAAASAEQPRELSKVHLLALLVIVATWWFSGPLAITKILDFLAWAVAYASTGGLPF
jgi:hypothetical protein